MKGGREGKGDGSRQQQQKGGAPTGETGPLFPRLHVNETEKAGPRAPPRNKMALYEQFTIPSHRFVPTARPAVASPYNQQTGASPYNQQYFSNEYRYSYPSYYMPPTLAYGSANVGGQTYGQPSFGVSSGSAVVDEDESQRVPGTQSLEKTGPSGAAARTTATPSTSSSHRNISGKKLKDDNDFRVPTLSSQRVNDRLSDKSACKVSEKPQKLCRSSSDDIEKSFVGAQTSSVVDCQQEASTTCKTRMDCPVSEPQSCGYPTGINAQSHGKTLHELQLEQADRQSGSKVLDLQNEDQSTTSPGHSPQQSDSNDGDCLAEQGAVYNCQGRPSNVQSTADVGTFTQCTVAGECASAAGDELDSVEVVTCNLRSTALEASCSPTDDLGSDGAQRAGSPVLEDKTGGKLCGFAIQKLHHSTKNRCESSGESENLSNGSGEVSEPSRPGEGSGFYDSDSSMLDSVSAPTISPKDVIQAVGQQQFWRARKAILRQQRIFSEQVFELHKLIKVQQLLAATPNVLIEEDIYFGTAAVMPECDADAPSSDADVPCSSPEYKEKPVDQEAQNSGSALNEAAKDDSVGAGVQPGVGACYPGWSQALNYDPNSHMYYGPYPSMPALIPGGMSAWGYPTLGAGQWLGPMAAQAGTFIYQPFAGSFPPGSAFGGAYGPAVIGPGTPMGPPPMVSFSLPGCDQRPEVPPDMYSRYGPAVAASHQWHSAMYRNPSVAPLGPDSSGSWHAMQDNHMDHNQRLPAVGNHGEVPLGSVASITNQPEGSVQTVKTLVPGHGVPFQSQWVNRFTGQSGSKELNRSGSHAEQSSFSAVARSNGNTLVPSSPITGREQADCGHQDEHGWAKSLNLAGAYHSRDSDYCADESSLVGKKDAHIGPERNSKRQKDWAGEVVSSRVMDEDLDADVSPDQSMNALSLFPLVPSLRSIDQSKGKSSGQAEVWQGRVIKVVPRAAVSAPESAAGILLSIQQERQQ